MTCRHRDDVGPLLLGALPADETLAVETHILQCDECAAARRELGVVRALLDAVDRSPIVEVPVQLGNQVVAQLVATAQHDRGRDLRLVLLGAAAAAMLVLGVLAVVRSTRSSRDGQAFELVATAKAPKAWAVATLHPRVDGTIVDLEAGDLPKAGIRYAATVTGPEAVLASQTFAVNDDGWAQVLLATTRRMRPGDTIEITRVDTNAPVTVLRCRCTDGA